MDGDDTCQGDCDWPYEPVKYVEPPRSEPTWECADGTCACHPIVEGEPLEFVVLLCDEHARPMPHARCRVLHGREVINEDQPNADADGWLSVTVRRPVRVVRLEWAPPETPLSPRYPYRMRYRVDIKAEQDRTSIRRRLQNLGFSQRGPFADNVKDFQRAFGYERITGNVDDIRTDLVLFHDRGWIPPIENAPGEAEEEDDDEGVPLGAGEGSDVSLQAFSGAVADSKPKPDRAPKGEPEQRRTKKKKRKPKATPVPRPEKQKKHPPAGGLPGSGTARPLPKGKLTLHVCSLFAQPRQRCRWDSEDSHPVVGAEIELFDAEMKGAVPEFVAANGVPKTGRTGEVTLKLGNLPDGEYVLKLNPPLGHELRGKLRGPVTDETIRDTQLRPAGPEDAFFGDPPTHTRFRFLEIALIVDKGVIKEPRLNKGMLHRDAIVAHGALLETTGSFLMIDWKPDWVQCGFTHGLKKDQRDPREGEALLKKVHFIVLHESDAVTPGSSISHFSDPQNTRKTGTHYLVDVDGHVIKMAHETIRTDHAGQCFWHGLDSYKGSPMQKAGFSWSDISIGIEQVHRGSGDYKVEQLAAAKNVIERVRNFFDTSHHNVLGHGEIALLLPQNPKRLGNKVHCPGSSYDWPFIERTGNATQPESAAIPHARYGNHLISADAVIDEDAPHSVIGGLQLTLSELGYFVKPSLRYDEVTVRAIEAFHNRYFSGERRPIVRGGAKVVKRVVDIESVEMMHKVLAARGSFIF